MKITFKPLWKLLIDRDMTKEDLCLVTGLSAATIAKIGKDGNVTTNVLARVCGALDCSLEQIALATTWSEPSGGEHERVALQDFQFSELRSTP